MGLLDWLTGRTTPPRRPVGGQIYGPQGEYRLEVLEGEEGGRGYVPVRVRDEQRLRWETLTPGYGIQSARVVGTGHRPKSVLQDPAFALGQPVALVREPENPYDRYAIAVWDPDRQMHLGYIQKKRASRLAKRLDKGEDLRAVVMWETRKGSERVGVRLLIVHEGMHAEISRT